MSRLPRWLKRPLLPIYNGGHRLAWQAAELLGALRRGAIARCELCGRLGPILFRRRVVPPRLAELWGLTPTLADALAHKESDECAWCGGKLRARRLAQAVLDRYPSSTSAACLADWVHSPSARSLRIAVINRIDGLDKTLSAVPSFAFSDYDPATPSGEVHDGVRCEDLQSLTYGDGSFDLVLTSETLEHVPDLSRALSEIHRILVPGGRHIFTVPVLPHVPKTFPRARLRPDGTAEDLAPRICHPGGDVGYPVFTEFGADLPTILDQHGFEVSVLFGPVSETDLAQVYICRKPLADH